MTPWTRLLCHGLTVVLLGCCAANGADFYVSTLGNDAWSGRLAEPNADGAEGPFATLERARDAIRQLKQAGPLPEHGVVVELRGGIYQRQQTWKLVAEDSGTSAAPIVYQARPGEEVRLVGGRQVAHFTPVTDEAVLGRLDEAARANVLQADLTAQGIADFGEVGTAGNRLEVFFAGRPMTLARWPNRGFVKIDQVVDGKDSGLFTYRGDRPRRWTREQAIWTHGYLYYDWSDSYQRVSHIDNQQHQIRLASAGAYGCRAGQRFYVLNVLVELDRPGEWYLDRDQGVLYFWPPQPLDEGRVMVSLLRTPLVALQDVSHVTIAGLTLESCRGSAVVMADGTGDRIVGCTVRNTGTDGVRIEGGSNHGVESSDIYQIGGVGIWLSGGNRKTLTPAGHYALNNHLHHFSRLQLTNHPGVRLNGVGNRLAHNRLHDAPHHAISLAGNDHVIEWNEVFRACTETNDSGAFYMGRNPSNQGNVLRYNFWHHIGHKLGGEDLGAAAIYLDDGTSGQLVFGNVFYRAGFAGKARFGAVFVHGGKGNRLINNIFVDCPIAVGFAPWDNQQWQAWLQGKVGPGDMQQRLHEEVDITRPPYSDRYPRLAQLAENPNVNILWRNVVYDCGEFIGRGRHDEKENWLTRSDPGFVDAGKMNFQLREDAIVFQKIPGFERIPFEQIGLYRDAYRLVLPTDVP